MKELRLKNGQTVILRKMTRDDILPGGNGRCPINCEMILGGDLEPTENLRILNEMMIVKYGTTAILATVKDRVIAFVDFFPTWCPYFDLCQDE
jgi:hypothetical protein